MPNIRLLTSAFVLTAGKGTRMMPLTQDRPKPLVQVFGKPILDHIFDHLRDIGIENVTLNGHYKAEQIEDYAKNVQDMDVSFSYEHDILDTGGGVKNALYTMPTNRPFYMINGDAYWINGGESALNHLASTWDDEEMDILLLLEPVERMTLTQGVGDYDLTQDGRAIRNKDQKGTHMFTGIRLVHPRVFEFKPFRAFSFLECMDEAESAGRLFGLEHEGLWHHLSTPEDITSVENA